MVNGTRIWPMVKLSVFHGDMRVYASSIFILPSSERSISALYDTASTTFPVRLKRALRTWKRPLPSSVWYSYLPRMVPCISGLNCAAASMLAVSANMAKSFFMCWLFFVAPFWLYVLGGLALCRFPQHLFHGAKFGIICYNTVTKSLKKGKNGQKLCVLGHAPRQVRLRRQRVVAGLFLRLVMV